MTAVSPLIAGQNVSLGDVVDRLLHKGVVINGDAMVSLAGVDLVYLRLSLLLSSVQRLSEEGQVPAGWGRGIKASDEAGPLDRGPVESSAAAKEAARQAFRQAGGDQAITGIGEGTDAGPNEARELGKLVLTLVDLLRRVLERQALRRMEADSLSEEETERMGIALMELDSRMTELCEAFGLRRDELDIDLGPLGKINA